MSPTHSSASAYRKNHTLSLCLLKRFTNEEDQILKHSTQYGVVQPRQPGREGFRIDLWTRTSAQAMEKLWSNEAENDMNGVFSKLDAQCSLTLNEKKLLARFLAVHYVRSEEFVHVYEAVRQSKFSCQKLRPELSFSDRYYLRLQLLRSTQIPSDYFEKTMLKWYYKVRDYLLTQGLEIGIATGSKTFVLPDCGLMLIDVATGHMQPSGGVPILDATHASMPLGPRCIAAFRTGVRSVCYRDLSDSDVTRANGLLKQAARRAYYTIP